MHRRDVLKTAAGLGAAGMLSACGSGLEGSGDSGSSSTLKIGYVSPQTGPLAGFATRSSAYRGRLL
jgi:branched-chain amino acid transport system substrate-binding protein